MCRAVLQARVLGSAMVGLAAAGGCSRPASVPAPGPEATRPTSSAEPPAITAGLPTLVPQSSGTANRLQAISAAGPQVAWASGVGGTWVVTTDGGETWRAGTVPGGESLEFRDVEAVSGRVAYLLAAGEGEASRIYKTEDGGDTWTLQFRNDDPRAFYDCFAFWSPARGLVFSDGVDGRFPARRTTDGRTWEDIGGRLPGAAAGEGGFAASGTCVATWGSDRAWIVTGGSTAARVLATRNAGKDWAAHATPIGGREGAGGFTIAFRDADHGILAGGDLGESGPPAANVAVTRDAGRHWDLVAPTPFRGAAYGLSYVPGADRPLVVATGPGGAAWSADEGGSWSPLPDVKDYWAVAFAGPGAGWLVGTEGRILKMSF